jgi:hypothetical protein
MHGYQGFSFTELQQRGWNGGVVHRLLGGPDLETQTVRGQPLSIWSFDRVLEAEATTGFQMFLATGIPPKGNRLRTAWAGMTLEDAYTAAIDEHNARATGDLGIGRASDPKHLNRITVNILRHSYSNYDELLRIGANHRDMKVAVLRRIARSFDALRDECDRQARLVESELRRDAV